MSLIQPELLLKTPALPDPNMFKIKSKTKKVILKFDVKLINDGVRIYIKSPLFESWFKQSNSQNISQWHDLTTYHYIPSSIKYEYQKALSKWGSDVLIDQEIPNLSMLKAVGLSDGITIILPIVTSRKEVKNYIKKSKLYLNGMFNEHIKGKKIVLKQKITFIPEIEPVYQIDMNILDYVIDYKSKYGLNLDTEINYIQSVLEDHYYTRAHKLKLVWMKLEDIRRSQN